MPVPSFVAGTSTYVAAASGALSVPASAQVGDVVVACLGSNGTPSTPTGWTLLASDGSSSKAYLYLLKITAAGDIKSYTFSSSGSAFIHLTYGVYRDVNLADPVDDAAADAAVHFGTVTFPSVTAEDTDRTAVYIGGHNDAVGINPPTGVVQRYEATGTVLRWVGDDDSIAVGAVGDRTTPAGVSSGTYYVGSVLLNPRRGGSRVQFIG